MPRGYRVRRIEICLEEMETGLKEWVRRLEEPRVTALVTACPGTLIVQPAGAPEGGEGQDSW